MKCPVCRGLMVGLENGSAVNCECIRCAFIPHEEVPATSVKRVPVDFRYDAINPTFLKCLAKIGAYAAEKYGSWEQYAAAELKGEKGCINHIYEHLRAFVCNEPHDKFGSPKWHLVAIAYNAMMQFFYYEKFGPSKHPLHVAEPHE